MFFSKNSKEKTNNLHAKKNELHSEISSIHIERLPISIYLRKTIFMADGLAWIGICIAALICGLDIFFGTKIFPIRDITDPEGTIVLLLFSPILIFIILILLRQLPFSNHRISLWMRVIFCVFSFLVINF